MIKNFTLLLFGISLVFTACRLLQSEKNTQALSFTKQYDKLAAFDSVHIVLKDLSGHTLDIIYRGTVDTIAEIENLPAPHWDGGLVIILVTGFKGGKIVYLVEIKFDGRTDTKVDSNSKILPGTTLFGGTLELRFTEGDSNSLPKITVTPDALTDKSILWVSSSPFVLMVGPNYIRALNRGFATLTAKLNSDTTKVLEYHVTVVSDPKIPDSIRIFPRILSLAEKGALGSTTISFFPSSADHGLIWKLSDSTVASISKEGLVTGLKKGNSKLWAVSMVRATIIDSIGIEVSDPVPVVSLRFPKDSTDLFVGGSAESLMVEISPSKAAQGVKFSLTDSSKITLNNNWLTGLAEGITFVVARSIENLAKVDTLKVNVFPVQRVDSLVVKPDSLRLFTGGPNGQLVGSLYPKNLANLIFWRSSDPSVASVNGSGQVLSQKAGRTHIVGISRADSTKQDGTEVIVKRDTPLLFVGRDTVISLGKQISFLPTVIQEFGKVEQFKWDLDGNGVWDDSSTVLKSVSYKYDQEKEYFSVFYVKDTEGNDTTATKKVKAVKGPVVQILSPLNNSFTNKSTIEVVWSIDSKAQDTLLKEVLNPGSNTIVRSAKDALGALFSSMITVTLDTISPMKPIVHGLTPVNISLPSWTWAGGGGGSGTFRYRLDKEDMLGSTELMDTLFIAVTELAEGVHTLFVQEKDQAGNWSQSGRSSIKIDLTGPLAPLPLAGFISVTSNAKPIWEWISGANDGMGVYRCKIDNNAMTTGTVQVTQAKFQSTTNLTEGNHILYVQERDSAGNWSSTSSVALRVDLTPPNAPIFNVTPRSPLNSLQPIWTWVSGGGGIGLYRYRIDTADINLGAGVLKNASFKPTGNLVQGKHTLYVQEGDSAGNWSLTASKEIVVALREVVGNAGFTAGTAYHLSIGITKVGGLYISYTNPEDEFKVTVMKFNGGSWEAVGNTGLLPANDWHASMALSSTGYPYIAASDSTQNGRTTVKRFTGTSWINVGLPGFSASKVINPTLVLSKKDIPFVASWDEVMRYNGNSWDKLGNIQGINLTHGINNGSAIAIDNNEVPFVAGQSHSSLSILKFIGTDWEVVGNSGFADVSGSGIYSLAMTALGEPIVAFSDNLNESKITVMVFRKGSWQILGVAGFSLVPVTMTSVVVSSAGVPYVAFNGEGTGSSATIMRFNGTMWETVGVRGFTTDLANLSLAVDELGVPFLAYTDISENARLTVWKTSFDP